MKTFTLKKRVIITLLACSVHVVTNAYNNTLDDFEAPASQEAHKKISQNKDWTFAAYIAGNNSLAPFVLNNLSQMKQIGSNDRIHIVVQLDLLGQEKTFRYYIEKGNAHIIESYKTTHENASGTTKSLYDFIEWAATHYPAQHMFLDMWNHGSGATTPDIWKYYVRTHRNDLFVFNPETCLLELDRNVLLKGIAFNDTFETCINNVELGQVLEQACQNVLKRKIDILGFDACHMAMFEIANEVKQSVNYVVASQEVEPGPGWNYERILKIFERNTSISPHEFSKHVVNAYQQEYNNVYADYTQSALSLESFDLLEHNLSTLSHTLTQLLSNAHHKTITETLSLIRTNKTYTTAFYNHNYIDLMHFYRSFLSHLPSLKEELHDEPLVTDLEKTLTQGIELLQTTIIANATGIYLSQASGLSIYFPLRSIHSSYYPLGNKSWITFLLQYQKTWMRPCA